jgi:hypothetical protein
VKNLREYLQKANATLKDIETCQRQIEVFKQVLLNAGKQPTPPSRVPQTAATTEVSPSEGHLEITANWKDEARKIIAMIRKLCYLR